MTTYADKCRAFTVTESVNTHFTGGSTCLVYNTVCDSYVDHGNGASFPDKTYRPNIGNRYLEFFTTDSSIVGCSVASCSVTLQNGDPI